MRSLVQHPRAAAPGAPRAAHPPRASISETTDNATEPDQEAVNDTVNDETVPLLRSSSEEILEFFRRN